MEHVLFVFSYPIWVVWDFDLWVATMYLQSLKILNRVASNSYIVQVVPLFPPPKRNHSHVIQDHYDMDHSSGLEHTNTFYQGLGPQ